MPQELPHAANLILTLILVFLVLTSNWTNTLATSAMSLLTPQITKTLTPNKYND
jgi:hypothetical protein